VRDQLLEIAGPNSPALFETDVRKRGELVFRETEDLEVRTSAIERDALLSRRGAPNRARRPLARELAELAGRVG
jgi:hypothetical protein